MTEAAARAGKGSDVDPTPAGAARLANSVISAYMTVIDRTSQQRAVAEAARLKAREGTLNRRIQGLQARVANTPNDRIGTAPLSSASTRVD